MTGWWERVALGRSEEPSPAERCADARAEAGPAAPTAAATMRWLAGAVVVAFSAVAVSPAVAGPGRGEPKQPGVQEAPLLLPGAGAARRAGAESRTWLVAGRASAATTAIARRFAAQPLLPDAGIFSVRIGKARQLARTLRKADLLEFAEPNVEGELTAFPADPLTRYQWWPPAVVSTETTPPATGPNDRTRLAVIDSGLMYHEELDGSPQIGTSDPNFPVDHWHGTAVALTAAAPANGRGIVGVFPGMGTVVIPTSLTCGRTVAAINEAIDVWRPDVINMSYGFPMPGCYAHQVATQYAYGRGINLVAAGGNDLQEGNYPSRPAVDPHVITVAAVAADRSSAFFSSRNDAIDVAAPGQEIATALPAGSELDPEGDGYGVVDGTSFSAPMVAAAVAWVTESRPGLSPDQVREVVRLSADDLGRRGWDERYGFGLLDIDGALRRRAPFTDPIEPNDDVEWIDGRRFRPRDPPIFRPHDGKRSIRARLDQLEDPADVFAVKFPPRSTLRVTVRPRYGNPDVEAYDGSVGTIYSRRGRIARSSRPGGATDRLLVTNLAQRARRAYVDTYIPFGIRDLDAAYRLTIQRVRYQG
jgi:hypothetical protein